MIRKISVWTARCTAEPQRLLVISECSKLARAEKYSVIKLTELCTACFVKNDLQAVLPSARQSRRT